MKNKVLLLATCLGLAIAAPAPARADTGIVSFGITNGTIAANTQVSLTGTAIASVKNQDFATAYFTAGTIATNDCNVVLTIAPVDGTGVVYTNSAFTITVPQIVGTPGTPTTNTVYYATNLASSVIGAADGLKLLTITNASLAGALQSPSLKLGLKVRK